MFWNIGDSYNPKRSKNLIGIPNMMFLGLQRQGWAIANDIKWVKRNAQPLSRGARLSTHHESIILCTKSGKYKWHKRRAGKYANQDVWSIPLYSPKKHDHGAVFPPEIPRRCIELGSDLGDVILDPFAGTGTTLAVADLMGRRYLGFDTSKAYAEQVFPERRHVVEQWFIKQLLKSEAHSDTIDLTASA
jgi:hypothetical protein